MSLNSGVGVREADLPWVDIAVRPGYKQRYKGFFDKARGIGLRIGSLYAEPYYHSPRHRHTFQQIRFVLSGEMKYGHERYGPGDCLYLPEGISYGPIKPKQEKDSEQLHFVDMQFMGPSGIPYPDPDEVVRAQRALAQRGVFEEGIYTGPDGRKKDAYEVILEEITGQEITYPPSRLTDYVVMRSGAYPSLPHKSLAGVSQKHLGCFFECGPNIKLLSMKEGATIPAGRPEGHRALFLISGEVEFGGEVFDSLSYFVFPNDTDYAAIKAIKDVEFLAAGWTEPGKLVPSELF